VDDLSMSEAVTCVEEFIHDGTPHQLTPVNANKLWQMDHHADLNEIVLSSSLILPEWAVVWAARVLRRPVRGHIGGIMLFERFLPVAASRGYRLFLLGARPAVVDALQRRLRDQFPNLRLAGFHHGYLSSDLESRVIAQIRESRPDFLLVAMGTPRQELWISRHTHELQVPVSMGVGGSFDVLAGLKPDAPAWARGHGLEWLYRLAHDPRNLWKRYLVTNPWFVYRVVRERALGPGKVAS
jgi:N-acetylglucosaminyldiphosphoundecaprenol N-acetyl-beta-D-mannosaminyltransferase